jgi:hypothetical protein
VHLLTILGLTLPIVPPATLVEFCAPLIQHLIWAYEHPWQSADADKVCSSGIFALACGGLKFVYVVQVAKTRVNRCLSDLMSSSNSDCKFRTA